MDGKKWKFQAHTRNTTNIRIILHEQKKNHLSACRENSVNNVQSICKIKKKEEKKEKQTY